MRAIDTLEVAAIQLAEPHLDGSGEMGALQMQTVCQFSLAISEKRIADSLEVIASALVFGTQADCAYPANAELMKTLRERAHGPFGWKEPTDNDSF